MARELSDLELNRLDGFLSRAVGGTIPNTEALDGFLAALACCPDLIMPSEFLQVLQTGTTDPGALVFDDMTEERTSGLVFDDTNEAQDFIDLVMRHWNYVNAQLDSGKVYLPLMIEDADGTAHGNDWAGGFVTGTHLRHEMWADVFNDEERGGALIPIFALAYEHHPDPEMRPFQDPLDAERREELIIASAAGVMRLHDMFESVRTNYLPDSDTFVRAGPKPGRNALCPCGSGKKFKKCCGAPPTLH